MNAACNNLLDYDHRRLASQVEDNLCEAYGNKLILVVKGSDANASNRWKSLLRVRPQSAP